jgi:hypothetical protein
MTNTTRLRLFALGALVMGAPGLFTAEMKWAFVAFLLSGYAILIVATVKSGGARVGTALLLLLAMNVAFWLSYVLWLFRLRILGPSPTTGIETFAGPLALWLFLLPPALLYEALVFFRGLVVNRDRTTAAVGLVATAAQVMFTLRTAYALVQGV